MKRWWALGGIMLAAGCQNPYPAANVFGPYGTRVVPPPATGTIGVPSGYAAPAAAPSGSYPPPPLSNGTVPSLPGQPPDGASMLIPPPGGGDVGHWESANSTVGPDLGFNSSNLPGSAHAADETARRSPSLAWQPPAAARQATSAGNAWGYGPPPGYPAPMMLADGRPVLGGEPIAYGADTVYIPPVRPSVVRPSDHAVVTYESGAPGPPGCCQPVPNTAGPLSPVPYAQPAIHTSAVDHPWEPRRLQ